jgi:carnosine N-methyltransferase
MFLGVVLEWLSEQGGPWPLHACLEAADMWTTANGDGVSPADFDKVLYVLKNIARDWSAEFQAERDASYGRIVDSMLEYAKRRDHKQGVSRKVGADHDGRASDARMQVLVPGCGLGRLCLDLVEHGFDVSGNEHSYFMLLMSAFILNGTVEENQWMIFPWMLNSSNSWRLKDQLRPCSFPDRLPCDMTSRPGSGVLGMIAGDFCEVFGPESGNAETYDAVITCFFLDTAHNVIEYMEIIWDLLVEGGVWIHLGPLQWHWADAHTYLGAEEMSVEVGFDAVVEIAKKIGFVFRPGEDEEEVESDVPSGISDSKDAAGADRMRVPYMSNSPSMRPQEYDCAMFRCYKKN